MANYQTIAVRVIGTVRGKIWMPATECTKDVDHTFRVQTDRFASSHIRGDWPGSLREALISEYVTNDGDFQTCGLEEDTIIIVIRRNHQTGTERRRTWHLRASIVERTNGEFNRGYIQDCFAEGVIDG